MLQILCSSVRAKLLARAKLIFLREQPDDFFSVGNPDFLIVTSKHEMLAQCWVTVCDPSPWSHKSIYKIAYQPSEQLCHLLYRT